MEEIQTLNKKSLPVKKMMLPDENDTNKYIDTTIKKYSFHMNSDNASSYINDMTSEYIVNLPEPIILKEDETAFLSTSNIMIPFSFYLVNNLNNILRITESDIDGQNENKFDIILPHGNYDIDQLRFELVKQLLEKTNGINYYCTYDSILNKVSISTPTPNKKIVFDFTSDFSCYRLFGFYFDLYELTSITPLLSPSVVEVGPFYYIYLRLVDMTFSYSFDMYNGLKSDILSKIAINVDAGDIIFQSEESTEIKTDITLFNRFRVALSDEYDRTRIIDLHGKPWQFTLILTVYTKEKI